MINKVFGFYNPLPRLQVKVATVAQINVFHVPAPILYHFVVTDDDSKELQIRAIRETEFVQPLTADNELIGTLDGKIGVSVSGQGLNFNGCFSKRLTRRISQTDTVRNVQVAKMKQVCNQSVEIGVLNSQATEREGMQTRECEKFATKGVSWPVCQSVYMQRFEFWEVLPQ
jgi:hypothetical protein